MMPITTFQLSSDALVVLLTCRPHWELCPGNGRGGWGLEDREAIQDGMEGVCAAVPEEWCDWVGQKWPPTNHMQCPHPSPFFHFPGLLWHHQPRPLWNDQDGVGSGWRGAMGLPFNHQPGCEAGTPSKAPSEGACQPKDVHPLHTQAGLASPTANPCLHSSDGVCHMAGACVTHRLCR